MTESNRAVEEHILQSRHPATSANNRANSPQSPPHQERVTEVTADLEAVHVATSTSVSESVAQAYLPTDRGFAAWRLLAVAYVFETLLWGFPLSFGVFQAYYSRLPQFEHARFVSAIGPTATALAYISAPFMIAFDTKYPQYRRYLVCFGWPICISALIAGSYAESIGSLIATQGLLYGAGFCIFYYPIIGCLNDFFIRKRGTIYGIMCSASGLSGCVMPFLFSTLLERYGYQFTLRAVAVGLTVLTGPLIPLLKGRGAQATSTNQGLDWSFLRLPKFWIYSLSNLAMSFAYFLPGLWLPTYSVANGATPIQGALLLALMSLAQVAGQITFGYLSDRKISIEVLVISSTLVTSAAVYTCWGFAGSSLTIQIVFALIYGFFATGFTSLWARLGTSISSDSNVAFEIFGLFNLQKGLANISAGVLGGALVNGSGSNIYGAPNYQKLILFVGSMMLLSSAIVAGYSARHLKWLLICTRQDL